MICGSMLLHNDKTIDEMKKAVNELYRLNDALRIRVAETEGQPYQYVTEYREQDVEILRFINKEELDSYASEYTKKPLDFYGSLCDIKIIILPDRKGILAKLHHFISDAWTLTLLCTQFNKILGGDAIQVSSYVDYISIEEKYLESKRYAKDKAYFLSQFEKCDEITSISEKQACSFTANRVTFTVDKEKTSKILSYIKEKEVSVFSLFMFVLAIYINRTKQNVDKFYIGTTIINRNGAKEQNTMGMFINTVPMLIELNNDLSFSENLKQVEIAAVSVLRHQRYNYGDLLEELREYHSFNEKLYDVMLSYQNAKVLGENFESTWYHNGMQHDSLQIHIDDRDSEGILRIHYDYLVDKFTESEIEKMYAHMCNLLFSGIENDSKTLHELNMLAQEEADTLLLTFNNTATDYPRNKCIHQLFEEQVKKTPDKTAVIFKDITLTYAELNNLVDAYAAKLKHLGVAEKDVVAVHLERSHRLIALQLAVLKIGAVFLPADKRFPVNRIAYMCDDCQVKLFISDSLSKKDIQANVIGLDDFEAVVAHDRAQRVVNQDACYIIYTSGSTGTPKGCLLTGKGLLNFCMNNNTLECLLKIENCVFASVNSVSFDYFIAESLLPLTNGFTTVILDERESTMQRAFSEVVAKNNINVLMTTPTRLKIYFENNPRDEMLRQFRCICSSGEPLTPDLLALMYEKAPFAKVYNPIGPSECSVWDMGGELHREDGIDIHIGKPIANAQIYITDKYLNIVPIGVTGEICIAGDGVGAGYLNRPELTAEKFIDNPFGEGELYRTGDLGYWREDGNIAFVGRNDFQVKIRGLRIELGEIEKAMTAVGGIVSGVVVVRKDAEGRQLLCAFYTGEEKNAGELRTALAVTLPKYMVPHVFVYLESLPMTTSGKTDRSALPDIDLASISTEAEYVQAETTEEKALAQAVSTVLKTDKVNMHDNFFNIGGDSINAIYIVTALEEKGYELHVADIMQSNTLAEVAGVMKEISDKLDYEQGEVNGIVPFSPIMRAFLQESDTIPKEFVHQCIIAADFDEETARKATDALIAHHDMLRGTFTENGIKIRCAKEAEVYSFKTITIADLQQAKEYLNKTKNEDDNLVHIVFCKTEQGNLLSITIHHFLVDLVSWEVLIDDFLTAVKQAKNGEEISLPAKTASFKRWNEELQKYAQAIPQANKTYWEQLQMQLAQTSSLYASDEKVNEAEKYSFSLDAVCSAKLLNDANSMYGTRTNELLLAALGVAAERIAGGAVGIMVESHGRSDFDKPIAVGRTVGWFTSFYPVVFNNDGNVQAALIATKDTMRRIPKNGIEYLLLMQGLHKNTDILFNFYQNNIKEGSRENVLISFGGGSVSFPGKTSVDCSVSGNIVTVHISVPKGPHRKQISEELGTEFKKQIENLVKICTQDEVSTKTRSDFSDDMLTAQELTEVNDVFGLQNVRDIYPVTAVQEGMYAQYFRSTDTKTYQLQTVCRISKEADLGMLRKGIVLLAMRHPVLNTAFAVLKTTGAVKQVVLANRDPEISVVKQDEPFSTEILNRIISEKTKKALDLQKDSLFRITVADFKDARFMMMHAHHIILDGWCLPVLIADLQRYYKLLANGTEEEALVKEINKEAALQTSYAQYVNWIRRQDKTTVSQYWNNLLAECSAGHIFGKEAKENAKNENIVTFEIPLSKEQSLYLEQTAKENKVSVNTVFECVFGIALQKFAGCEDIVFDKVISGRGISLKNIEKTVGPFIHTVPVRIRNEADSTFADLLKETQRQTVAANENGILPLAKVYKAGCIDSNTVDALFVFENYFTGDMSEIANGPLTPEIVSFEEQTEFNLTVTILKYGNRYTVRTAYAKEMYTDSEIASFTKGYIAVLKSSLDKTKRIQDISVLTKDEEQQILYKFNDTSHEYTIPVGTTLYSLFEKASEENNDKICITIDNKKITFKEFKSYAERIDGRIRNITQEKSVIAVICERSFEMYGAVYGIIRGGNAYLPIDPNYPQERIDYILANSQAKAVVAQDKFCYLAKDLPCIDATQVLQSNEEYAKTECRAEENDTAYVIYTSGSTGNPKGAKISHKSAINRILWMHDKYPLEENDVILQKTPYTFDVSVWELFWWGITGRSLCASMPDEHFLPAKILEETEKNRVTHLHFVPSVFDLFLTYLENNKDEWGKFASVRYVFLSGEALTANHIDRFYKMFDSSKVHLHNLYGPTECAVDVTYYDCMPTDKDPVPIGKPIYNTQMHIVDKYMNLTPVGVTGELCIAGVNVGQGYLNNEELTNEKFIDNPFGEGKLYKTGDLAYWREDGNIVFVGRKDGQIKLHGQRIEIGEIETVLVSHPSVSNAVVVVKTVNARQLLTAFYCAESDCEEDLRSLCESRLPHYMVPAAFVCVDKIPLNPNGKADRKMLLQVPIRISDTERRSQPAQNEQEQRICELFSAELGITVGRNDSFFACGGTSLSMISLLSQPFFEDISAADFIANPTPAKLANFIISKKSVFTMLKCLHEAPDSKNALVLFPYAGGGAEAFGALVNSFTQRTDLFSVYYADYRHSEKECRDVADEIALLCENKKVFFYSHCAGSAVAMQVLNILENEKQKRIEHFVAGGNIPTAVAAKSNVWRKVPKRLIKLILGRAGASFATLSREKTEEILQRFLTDTDYSVSYFASEPPKINSPVSLLISKQDLFTRNYEQALPLWQNYARNVKYIHYIESKSHYFQTECSDATAAILLSVFL